MIYPTDIKRSSIIGVFAILVSVFSINVHATIDFLQIAKESTDKLQSPEGQAKTYYGESDGRTFVANDGSKFVGEIYNGRMVEGTEYDENGIKRFKGTYDSSGARKEGTKYDKNGIKRFKGTYSDNDEPREGTAYYDDGSVAYKGTYVNRLYYKEEGTTYFKNGDRYVGTFNQWHFSRGIYYFKNGEKFVGSFCSTSGVEAFNRTGAPHSGTFYYENGDKYEGTFQLIEEKNVDYRKGTQYYNGYKIIKEETVGYYKGTYYYENGDKYIGIYDKKGEQKEGIFYYKNGKAKKIGRKDIYTHYEGFYRSYNVHTDNYIYLFIYKNKDGSYEGAVGNYLLNGKKSSDTVKETNINTIKGTYVKDTKEIPFTIGIALTTWDDENLVFESDDISTTFYKQNGVKIVTGEYSGKRGELQIKNDGKDMFSGTLVQKHETFNFKGEGSNALFYGELKNSSEKYPIMIFQNEVNRLTLITKNLSEEFELKNVPLKTDSYLLSLTHNGEDYYKNGIGMQFAYVAPGTFKMGGLLEFDLPEHMVTITKPYLMGIYEVTQDEYKKIIGTIPYSFSSDKGGNMPVVNVSWFDAEYYCTKLTEKERANGNLQSGYVYRLPTEAEWEYAARGGKKSKGYKYSGSDDFSSIAHVNGDNMPVGLKSPNELGLYDMVGNAMEWVSDWYDDYSHIEFSFSKSNTRSAWIKSLGTDVDPKGTTNYLDKKVIKSFYNEENEETSIAYRYDKDPDGRSSMFGFRIVIAKQ